VPGTASLTVPGAQPEALAVVSRIIDNNKLLEASRDCDLVVRQESCAAINLWSVHVAHSVCGCQAVQVLAKWAHAFCHSEGADEITARVAQLAAQANVPANVSEAAKPGQPST